MSPIILDNFLLVQELMIKNLVFNCQAFLFIFKIEKTQISGLNTKCLLTAQKEIKYFVNNIMTIKYKY